MVRKKRIDKVRASRDGHEFHEAWTARKALQLLWPDSELVAIAVEGLSPSDQVGAPAAAVEVADVTLYYGHTPSFERATKTTVVQFKYSIARKDEDFRASSAAKTVRKFAQTYVKYKKRYWAQAVEDRLDFQLITNQPISDDLLRAIDAIAAESNCTGNVKKQANQIKLASGLSGRPLAAFARKLTVAGRAVNLPSSKNELASIVVDWSATGSDSIASARLGKLRELVREKAGYAGSDRNLIVRTDVLAALQIGDVKDLLPCDPALVDVGQVLEREQLTDALARTEDTCSPLLIHATGGVGKTVFMNSLATKLAAFHEVVFFDCFGGGAYRSPEDARHLPRRGLIHIANTLAFRGLCDPMLPDSPDLQALLSTFRRRLTQCVATLTRLVPGRQLVLLLDAIDNAEFVARQRSEDCFPLKLLESLESEPIAGVKLIASCRTERKPKTYAKYEELKLTPFTKKETTRFLVDRLNNPTQVEINVAQARSGGNARVLDYLLRTGRGLLDPSEIDNKIELDDLIQQRIADALSAALERGSHEDDVQAFLAGLAVLPPPVPIDEYAGAHGIDIDAIESFASDLIPLLERTSHGLMFRDEPTETLVHQRYATSQEALRRVASNLLARQESSVYAARALPELFHQLDEGAQLFALAFDERIPAAITSTVGKRNVRYARLKVATLHAALKKDYNSLVRLLVELSAVAAVDQRGVDYILDHPDLVVAAADIDSRRRLFEVRTDWPGTRHARLAIAHGLSGEGEEAYRHAHSCSEWINHYIRNDQETGIRRTGPEHIDVAAIPFFLISQGRGENAARNLQQWQAWYAYEVAELVFSYAQLAGTLGADPARGLDTFVDAISEIGSIAGALSFCDGLAGAKRELLINKLAKLCKSAKKIKFHDRFGSRRTYELEDGLRKASTLALAMDLKTAATKIAGKMRHERPGLWSFRDSFNHRKVSAYMYHVALIAAINQQPVHEKDLLPTELTSICSRIPKRLTGKLFRDKAKENLSKVPRKQKGDNDAANVPKAMSYDEQRLAEQFLGIRIEPLINLTSALSAVLAASIESVDERFVELVEAWEQARRSRDPYQTTKIDELLNSLGFDAAFLILWTRAELKTESAKRFLEAIVDPGASTRSIVNVVSILAQRLHLQPLAGELAIRAQELIENEDDVNSRASLFGALGRAMLPASIEEASAYFRAGLEQMDAIGSGDYKFTNELLLFASQVRGGELHERDFHTLTNICELNLGDEPEKFHWGAFGHGMARVAGLRGLAKISRWDDRSKISLKATLLPYLTGLLEVGKIGAADALALNRLADPLEFFYAGTKEFATALRDRVGPDPIAIAELINQFQDDNPNFASDSTVDALRVLAEEALGTAHEITRRTTAARDHYKSVNDGRNRKYRYDNTGIGATDEVLERNERSRQELSRIAKDTDPLDSESLARAIAAFNALGNMYDLKAEFFSQLREKVPYQRRGQFIRNIASNEDLYFYWKIAELKETKAAWVGSSTALSDIYRSLAHPLIHGHVDELVDDDRLSGSSIRDVSELTGVPMAELVMEVIKLFARPNSVVAGSIWLAFASFIAPEADEGQAQLGLQRLLASDAARLAQNVRDGAWSPGSYPPDNVDEVAAGLVWRVLGSPHAEDRWRAAHTLRSFARFDRWSVIDCVVQRVGSTTITSFQAPELAFYNFHASLWLLIALARIALDHPDRVARYKDTLLAVVEADEPHVLMQDIAAKTLIACVESGHLDLPSETLSKLHETAKSPYLRLRKKIRQGGDFYQGRPKDTAEPPFDFHLDYEFQKHDVDSLAHVFGAGCWEVADMMSGIAHKLDAAASGMHDSGGRESRGRDSYQMSSRFHNYGQQLGWHALFFAAAQLLATRPITEDWWYSNPWGEWLGRYGLTRQDGLWLSDGTDRVPLDVAMTLLDSRQEGLEITGSQAKILKLCGIEGAQVESNLVVEARWFSADNIRIHISSALVPPAKATQLATELVGEMPMIVWVPAMHQSDGEDEHRSDDKTNYTPWIVLLSGEAKLDEHDPYGVAIANERPRLARIFASKNNLVRSDPFGREWHGDRGEVALQAQVWGREGTEEGEHHPGERLLCNSTVLKKILATQRKDLLVLVNLQRYEKQFSSESRYTHSVAVVRVDASLNVEYFPGPINHLHKSNF